MLIDFETYLILNELPGRCNFLRISGKLCRNYSDGNSANCCYHQDGDTLEVTRKIRKNMNTISFHIAQAVFDLSHIGSWRVSTQSIEKWIIANKHYAPRKNMLKKRLGEMVDRGELIPVKRSYRLTPSYRKKFNKLIPKED